MDLSEQIKTNCDLSASICQQLSEEINKLGFAAVEVQRYPLYDDADFVLIMHGSLKDSLVILYCNDVITALTTRYFA